MMLHTLSLFKAQDLSYNVAVRVGTCIVSLNILQDTTEHSWQPNDKATNHCVIQATKGPIVTCNNTI